MRIYISSIKINKIKYIFISKNNKLIYQKTLDIQLLIFPRKDSKYSYLVIKEILINIYG